MPSHGHSLTRDEVWRAHLQYAEVFRAAGLQPGQLVLVAVGNSAAAVALFLAARARGLATVAVDAGTTAAEMRELCSRFGVAAIAVPPGTAGREGAARVDIPGALELVTGDPGGTAYTGAALLKLTSGSTGLPKAIHVTEQHLIADSEQIIAGMGIGPDDTQVAVIPLSHAYGVSVVLVPLILQGTTIVLRDTFVPHRLPEDARAYGATTFPGVPFMFEHFLAHPPDGGWPDGLRRLISAGARLEPGTVRGFLERFGLKIHTFYGASESGGISYDAEDDIAGDTVGRPLPGVTVAFHPDEHAPRGAGRVHVTSAGVATGYVGESNEAFCDGGFLTGDYGLFDARGQLTLTGRASAFINVAGRKVHPAEVEDVLRQMPGVRDVRVLAAADPRRGEHVAACIVVDSEQRDAMTALTVRQHCSARLAPHKIPRTVAFVDAIPLTARGKTDRRALDEVIQAHIDGPAQQLC